MFLCLSARIYFKHHVSKFHNPQNRKYITYCTVIREGLSHGQCNMHSENVVKFGHVVFEIYASKQTDRQTDMQKYRHTDCNVSHP